MGKKAFGEVMLALLLLLLGGGIYLLLRPPLLLLHEVAGCAGLGEAVAQGRRWVFGVQLPSWMLFSLPGALWAAAYILVVDAVLARNRRTCRLLVAAFIPCVGIASELLQLAAVLPGTYDSLDLVFYALPYVAYLILAAAA